MAMFLALDEVKFYSRTCTPEHQCQFHCWGIDLWAEPVFCAETVPTLQLCQQVSVPTTATFTTTPPMEVWEIVLLASVLLSTGLLATLLGLVLKWNFTKKRERDYPFISKPFRFNLNK